MKLTLEVGLRRSSLGPWVEAYLVSDDGQRFSIASIPVNLEYRGPETPEELAAKMFADVLGKALEED